MLFEMHMIQSFAPANLNRDDTNNPKDCEFGGVRRARISSQCLKRSIRRSPVFAATTHADDSVRTRYLTRALCQGLASSGKPEGEVASVARALAAAYTSKKNEMDSEDPERTKVAVYLSKSDIEWLKGQVLDHWDGLVSAASAVTHPSGDGAEGKGEKAKTSRKATAIDMVVEGLVDRTASHAGAPDIALFGRMLADRPETNVDAACQVAHAISTHRVTMEMDFFTAVDDLQESGEPGAGMMGFTGYNSACFYRYARIDWEQLVRNLSGDTALAARTVEAFVRASVVAIPTGKQNAFAAQNPPSLVLGVVRNDGMSWSLANAFERPVRPTREGGLVQPSVEALVAYWARLRQVYGKRSDLLAADGAGDGVQVALLAVDDGLELGELAAYRVDDLEAWVAGVLAALRSAEEGA